MQITAAFLRTAGCWLLLAAALLALTLNRHATSKAGRFTYKSEVWADKAGYYVYLPATFLYGFDARAFPDSVEFKTGKGFQLDRTTGKVITKYPYGVALLQSPFWLAAHALSTEKTGFSKLEHKSIDIAAVCYVLLGLGLLWRVLQQWLTGRQVVLTLAVLLLGTNLGFYAVIETGMSHVYAFFAFALLLHGLHRLPPASTGRKSALSVWLQIGVALALIVALRPIDAVWASPLLLWGVADRAGLRQRLRELLRLRVLVVLVLCVGLLLLPQLAYSQSLKGSMLTYSYGQEGFPYWARPKLLEVWLAPEDGLFLYNPVLLLVPVGLVLLWRRRPATAALVAVVALGVSYTYAAWWAYTLGCSYGHRGFVDFLPVLALPLGVALQRGAGSRWRRVLALGLVLLIAYNLKLSFAYETCFPTDNDWDWAAWWKLLTA